MSGRGKGGTKRHRKVIRENVQGITKPAVRRLARRGGVKRISGDIDEEIRGVLRHFLESGIRDSATVTEHTRRKTVAALDVASALTRQGRTLYGFSTAPHPDISHSRMIGILGNFVRTRGGKKFVPSKSRTDILFEHGKRSHYHSRVIDPGCSPKDMLARPRIINGRATISRRKKRAAGFQLMIFIALIRSIWVFILLYPKVSLSNEATGTSTFSFFFIIDHPSHFLKPEVHQIAMN
jgi:histone H4